MTTCKTCGQTSLIVFESHPDYCPRCVGKMKAELERRASEQRRAILARKIEFLLLNDPGCGDVCRDLRERNPDDGRAPRQREMRFCQ